MTYLDTASIDEAEGLFQDTCEEVECYFSFLESAIEHTPALQFSDELREFDSSVLNTMKASAYLMLYNLIEATTDKVFGALHEGIKQADFDELVPELQYYLLRSFKNMKQSVNEQTVPGPIAKTLHRSLLTNFKLFSGNIDVRKIESAAGEHCLNIVQDDDVSDGSRSRANYLLLTVKTIRNQVAHGEKSFNEVGRDTAIEELVETKEQVIGYLTRLLESAEAYLSQQHYRRQHVAVDASETITQ